MDRTETETETVERPWAVMALVGTATAMVFLGSTTVFVAVPAIEEALGFSPAGVQWVVSAFSLASGGFLLLGGRAADLLGRRRVFVAGVALYTGAALLCGLAWSGGVLIAARVVQSVAAAIVPPASLSIVLTAFPDGPRRNRALGVWSGISGFGATAGLLLGGPLTDGLGWEWVFFVHVPVGLAVLALARSLPAGPPSRRGRGFDLAGALTVTGSLFLLILATVQAPEAGWTDLRTVLPFAGAVVLAALFVHIERRSPDPLVPLSLFRSRVLVGGNLVLLCAGVALDGMLYTLTLYAQGVLGYSAVQYGLMMAVMTVTSIAASWFSQAAVGRLGFRPVAAGGIALVVAGSLWLSGVSADGSFLVDMLGGLVLFGIGMGGVFVAGSIAALEGVPEERSGLASGVQTTSFEIGNAFGVALLSTVALARTTALLAVAPGTAEAEAITAGFRAAFLAGAGCAALGLLAALLLLRQVRSPGAAPASSTTAA